jgi:hypothetical protein
MGLIAMPLEQTVECLLLSDFKLTRLDARMVDTKKCVDVIHGLCSDIGEFLDFGSGILDLGNDGVRKAKEG